MISPSRTHFKKRKQIISRLIVYFKVRVRVRVRVRVKVRVRVRVKIAS